MGYRYKAGLTVVCGFVFMLVGTVGAQDVAGKVKITTNLNEIVVSAMREAVDTMSTPAAVYKLDGARKTAAEGVRTTPDVLEGVPSVFVQKTSYGQGSPYLRGFTGFRTLCLIDGVRLNNSVFRDGPNQYWNTVDPLSIATYELLMGPASVLYGSDAIGGTLNAIPIAGPDYTGKPTWESLALYRWSSAEDSHVGRIQTGAALSDSFSFILGGSVKSFGDLRGGRDVGRQKHTGYEEQDVDFVAGYKISKDVCLSLGHQTVFQDDAWRTHKTIYGISWEGCTVGDDKVHSFDQERDLTYLKLTADNMKSAVEGLEVTLSRHYQTEDLYRVKKDSTGERQGFDVDTLGAAVQMKSPTALGQFVYGAEYYRDKVESYLSKLKEDGSLSKEEIQGPVADDSKYDSAGVYLQDTLRLMDGALDVVPGVRWNYDHAYAGEVKSPVTGKKISIDRSWNEAVGSLRVLHALTRERTHTVFAGASQGFRAPNLSDLSRYDTARTKEIETPAPDLDPERFITYEAGYKARTGDLSLQASYYYTTIDKMIIRTPTGETIDDNAEVTKMNSGDGYIQGGELSVRYAFTRAFSCWLSGSVMDGKVDTYPSSKAEIQRDYVTRLMPTTGEVGARLLLPGDNQWIELVCNTAARADKLSADDKRDTQRIPPGGTPGYFVASVRYGCTVMDSLQVNAAVENVMDEDYRIHGSGVNEPGRNMVVTVSKSF